MNDPGRGRALLAQRFPEVVVKLGAEGALWTERQRRGAGAGRGPGRAAALDTTGAGDAFAAGLLAARLQGAEPARALPAGCALAARAVARGSPPARVLKHSVSVGGVADPQIDQVSPSPTDAVVRPR